MSTAKSKRKSRPSGVKVTMTKTGFTMKAFGPNAPDLRTVVPQFLGQASEDDDCRTCSGGGRIRDGETKELRRCLDCNGSGLAP